jgi:hypothetical protein
MYDSVGRNHHTGRRPMSIQQSFTAAGSTNAFKNTDGTKLFLSNTGVATFQVTRRKPGGSTFSPIMVEGTQLFVINYNGTPLSIDLPVDEVYGMEFRIEDTVHTSGQVDLEII